MDAEKELTEQGLIKGGVLQSGTWRNTGWKSLDIDTENHYIRMLNYHKDCKRII